MSLNRQRPRSRVSTRANTLPSLTVSNSTNTTLLPSIEESLQDWLTRSIPETPSSSVSWLLDTCRCCNQPGCENLETLSSTFRKLESDARLAAEIGQSLLQKHEEYVVESNVIKLNFEEQLDQAKEKIVELEQLLVESEAFTEELQEQKDKAIWEWQKIQKTLDQTAADLDLVNQRCILLESELKSKSGEVDSLRVFKIMARQADIREDTLRLMIEDSKHELGVSRKKELSLEANFKKLKTKYEILRTSYERLKTSQHDTGGLPYDPVDLVWLRESNERLRKDVLKLTSALLLPSSNGIGTTDQSQLAELIMELASANNKLKEDLLDCRDLLKESHNEINILLSRLEDTQQQQQTEEEDDEESQMILRRKSNQSSKTQQGTELYKRGLSIRVHNNNNNKGDNNNFWLSSSAPEPNEESLSSRLRKIDAAKVDHLRRSESFSQKRNDTNPSSLARDIKILENIVPLPTSSTSLPTSTPSIVHHHYHYHLRKKTKIEKTEDHHFYQQQQQQQQQQRKKKEIENGKKKITIEEPATINTPSSSKTITKSNKSPYRQLHMQVSGFHQRLRQSDPRAMNRKLRRAFDLLELSNMSNTIIENIIIDIDGIKTQYLWLQEDDELWQQQQQQQQGDVAILEFFPILGTFQDILKEIGNLRIAMNDLQVEYVKKIEERGVRLEEEVKKKYEENEKTQQDVVKGKSHNSSFTNWLNNVFQRSSSSTSSTSSQVQQQQQQLSSSSSSSQQKQEQLDQKPVHSTPSQESLHYRFLINNSNDTNHIYSSSIHPLAIPSSQKMTSEEDYLIKNGRRKKSDFDRYGPPSSFPERPSISEKTRKYIQSSSIMMGLSSIANNQQQQQPLIRASQSAGTMRKSKSMHAPVLEYAVRKKRSTLITSREIGSQAASPDLGGAFATSWLGNK